MEEPDVESVKSTTLDDRSRMVLVTLELESKDHQKANNNADDLEESERRDSVLQDPLGDPGFGRQVFIQKNLNHC